MHLAFAITEYFPFGGAQRDFIAVANAMAKRGHQITVITTAWQGEQNQDWQYLLLKHDKKTNHGRMRALSDYVIAQKKKCQFDAVIGFTKMKGLDIYFAADNCFGVSKFKGINRFLPRYRTYAAIERSLFENRALKVFYLTEIQREQYQRYFKWKQNNSVILPVCVDDQYFYDRDAWLAAREWRRTLVNDKKVVLLFVAADFKTKGLDRVISAFEKLEKTQQSRFVLWVVGEGKQSAYLAGLKQLNTVDVTFFGGQSELRPFYLAADYLVHPARKEAAGMVLAEAMAARLPLCVSDVCGYSFLAKDDPESVILDQHQIISELVSFLKNVVHKSKIPERGKGSKQVLTVSRAEFCADQIEVWLKH